MCRSIGQRIEIWDSPGGGVTSSHESHHVDARKQSKVLCKSHKHS